MGVWLTENRLDSLLSRYIDKHFGPGKGKFGLAYKEGLERIFYDLTHAKYECGQYVAYADTYTEEMAYQFQKWGCCVTWFQHWSGEVSWQITMPETHEQEVANKASLKEDWGE